MSKKKLLPPKPARKPRASDPNDLVRALVGVFHTAYEPGWEQTARRLFDILVAGSRPAR